MTACVEVLSWRVSTSVLAEVDLESFVLFSTSYGLNCFDRIGNVSKIDKRAAFLTQGVD